MVQFSSIIIKDENDKIEFFIPNDKYVIETRVVFETRRTWMLKYSPQPLQRNSIKIFSFFNIHDMSAIFNNGKGSLWL